MRITYNVFVRSTALRILISLSLLIVGDIAKADTADDYYHRGAQHYVFNEKEEAKLEVETGQLLFPTDPKLNSLASLLKKEEEQKEQQNQKQDQKERQQKQDQKKNQEKSEDQKKQEQEQQQQEQKKADEQKAKEQQQAGKKPDQKPESAGNPENKNAQPNQQMEVRMTPQQAKQLLDTQKDDERMMIFLPESKTNRANRVFKDW